MKRATVERPLDWPEGAFYHSPRGLYDFQADGIAKAYLETLPNDSGVLVVWDTGTGKSHFGMRIPTLFFEDVEAQVREFDMAIVVCERGKVGEWRDDFLKFTTLDTRVHHGEGRRKRLERDGLPQVMITTYETGKADLTHVFKPPGARQMKTEGAWLFEEIKDKKVLWIFDEVAKLRNRASANYKAYYWLMQKMQKAHPLQHNVIGLTATPIERDWEDAFNIGRICFPHRMPTVDYFDKRFVRYRDPYGRAEYYDDRMHEFVDCFRGVIQRKRKTDPDVIKEFPKVVEEVRHFQMGPVQQALYEMVEDLGQPPEGHVGSYTPPPGLWTVLRQIADDPASLVLSARRGQSKLCKMLVEEFGAQYLLGVPSVKRTGLVEYLSPIVKGQGAKVAVFSFFGPTVLPILQDALREKRIKTYITSGDTASSNDEIRKQFRADPDPCVLLTSDAGARGVNLPEATYIVEFESALTYANRTQRVNRSHRIDSEAEYVNIMTFITDYSVEVKIIKNVIERNKQTDILLGDEDAGENFMTAADRREAMQVARLRPKRSKR